MSAEIYTDFQALAKLRAETRAEANSPENLRRVAGQFEALFMQMVLRSMREANLSEGLFGSDAEKHYQDMFDAQLTLKLAQGPGVGLAETLVRQLSRVADMTQAGGVADRPAGSSDKQAVDGLGQSPEAFARGLWPHARQAAGDLGVAPEALIAQAALETGWGKSPIRHPDGRSSYNLFGVKAGAGWPGERVSVPTLEYENGVAVRGHAEFRAYGSLAEGFADYVRLLKEQPRYREALDQARDPAAFAQALQRAGYATDPAYAQKIEAILNRGGFSEAVAALKVSGERPLT